MSLSVFDVLKVLEVVCRPHFEFDFDFEWMLIGHRCQVE
jgi:hypothetical protein